MNVSSGNLLQVSNVSRSFADQNGEKPVLTDISFGLDHRDSLAVIGPSGCGKTTLLLMADGLLPPTSGRIHLNGRAISGPRQEMALVLQDYGLFPWKTVHQNIELGVRLRKNRMVPSDLDDLENELGISGLGHLYPQQLSGGQRQRVALARALVLKPELLLLDEPFAALDTITRERLQQALLDLFVQRSFSFIIVTHNIEEAAMLGKRIIVLGGQPTSLIMTMDNPTFGLKNQRESEAFFRICRALRRKVEEL